jgi:N4-gp56 family major capsid protein
MAFSPAGNLTSTSSITHLATVHYDRTALSSLRKKFMFWKGVDNRTMPKKNGKTIQFYRYSQLGANTTPVSEGTTGGVSQTLTSATVSATVAQYADFISFSDMLVDTAIDGDIVAVGADQLGYRAGLSNDTIVRNEIDSVAASIDVALLGDYFTGLDGANIQARFAGLDIRPFPNGYYPAIIHPYTRYDFIHDPQVGGFLDVVKQAPSVQGHDRLFTLEDRGYIGRFAGIEYWESTNVAVTAGSPNTYRNYFFGLEGLAAIDLAGRGPTKTMDQNVQKFSVNVVDNMKPGPGNPEGKIRALVSYNYVFVTKVLDTNPYRMRKIDAPTSLGL